MKLGTRSFDFTNNVGHTSFVTNKSSQMNWSLRVGILREMTDTTTVVLGSLLWEKLKGPMTGLLELAVGHLWGLKICGGQGTRPDATQQPK